MASKTKPDPSEVIDANGVSLADAMPAPEPGTDPDTPSDGTPRDEPVSDEPVSDEPVALVHPDSDQVIYADPGHVSTYTDAGWYLQPADEPVDEPEPDQPKPDTSSDDNQKGA